MSESGLSVHTPAVDPDVFPLDPDIVFLNHGSFGSCPRAVLEYQTELRDQLEEQPITFLVRELESRLDEARGALAQFVGADSNDLAFVSNATTGVNTVLRSLEFTSGDELLVTNHEYNACRNALDYVSERSGARVVMAEIPFPLGSAQEVIDAVLAKVTDRTRLLLIDHVTSPTGMVLPIAPIIEELNARGIDTLVDGAHTAGMVPLNIDALGATYYSGNCHKWLCAPKGVGFLHVQGERQQQIRPLTISHGANSTRTERSRFRMEFDWPGTTDPSGFLSLPFGVDYINQLVPGGWSAIMKRNRELALAARDVICAEWKIEKPCPDEMIGCLAAFPIADAETDEPPKSALYLDPWQDELMGRYKIEVPIVPWPAPPKRLLRISAQLYNSLPQFELLAKGIKELSD